MVGVQVVRERGEHVLTMGEGCHLRTQTSQLNLFVDLP